MGIRFACHGCDKRLNVKRDLAGKRGVCPECSTRFRIPIEDADRSSPVDGPGASAASKVNTPATSTSAATARPRTQSPAGTRTTSPATASSAAASDSIVGAAPQTVVQPEPESDAGSSIDVLADDATSVWYVRPPTGGQYGPATSDILRGWIDEGRVAATSLLWRDGWPQWRVASEALPDLIQPSYESERKPAANSAANDFASYDAERSSGNSPSHTTTFDGRSDLGVHRRARTSRRILLIALLLGIAVALIVALVIIVNRG